MVFSAMQKYMVRSGKYMGLFSTSARETVQQSQLVEHEPEEPEVEEVKVQPQTVIAKGIAMKGDFTGVGEIRIEGYVKGNISVEGNVVIEQPGLVEGQVEAYTVEISGRVKGNVLAHEMLQLKHTGVIQGDVVTVAFTVEEGGALNGRSTMRPRKEPLTAAQG